MKSEFSALGLSDGIVTAMDDMGWTEPTPIQTESVPVGIEGRDLLAQAQTGTGKTGTYGSIILERTKAAGAWPKALVLTPTRELALQVSEELEKLSKYTGHKTVPVYGGVSMLKQTQAMDKGADIIVATPGRLCDHLKSDERLLDDVSVVVLDESDRMLDMGFRRDLEFILARVPEERQTMLFSATMSKDIRKLALNCLDNPKEICVSKDEMVLDLIDQKYIAVEKDDKIDMLRYVLAHDPMRTIVFCFTKYRVDKVVRKLKMSFKLAGIHGEYSQNRREETLRKFKDGTIEVLVASDIAARGLDIEDVERVINFDMPPEAETYVHRIGRTGRAGKRGLALSFVMREDKKVKKEIENLTLIPMEEIPAPSKEEIEKTFSGIRELQRPVMAKKNSRKNDVPVKEKVFVVAEINVGREDGLGKSDIARMIKEHTTVPKKSIGDIYISEKTTALQIEKRYLSKTEDGLSKCDVNGKSIKLWKISEIEGLELKHTLEDEPDDAKPRKEEKHQRENREKSERSSRRDGDRRERGDRDGYRERRSDSGDRRGRNSYGGNKPCGRRDSDRRDSHRDGDSRRGYKPRDSDRRNSYGDRDSGNGYRPRDSDRHDSHRDGNSRGGYSHRDSDRGNRDSYGNRDRNSYGGNKSYGRRDGNGHRDSDRRGNSYGNKRDNHFNDDGRPYNRNSRQSRDRFAKPRDSRRY